MSPFQQHYQARWIQLQLIFIILWQLEWNHYGKTNVFGILTTPQTRDVNITRHLRHHVLSVNAFHLSDVWKSKQQAVHRSLQQENFCQIQGPNFLSFRCPRHYHSRFHSKISCLCKRITNKNTLGQLFHLNFHPRNLAPWPRSKTYPFRWRLRRLFSEIKHHWIIDGFEVQSTDRLTGLPTLNLEIIYIFVEV